MMLNDEIEVIDNERSSDGNTSGSVGSDNGSDNGSGDGSGGSGSDRGIDGSSRGTNGSAGNEFAEFGSADERGGIDNSRRIESDANADVGSVEQLNESVNRPSRAERIRHRRPIRLNRDDRDRYPGSSDSSGAGSAEIDDNGNNQNPVIRLGAKPKGAPSGARPEAKAPKTKLDKDVRDLIKMFTETLFEIPATALKQDFWRLTAEESKQLNDAIIAYLASLPDSDQSKIADFVGKHMPIINLAMVGFFIIQERVKTSIAVYNATKDAQRFAAAVNTPTGGAPANSRTVKTAMDSLFSN